MRRSCLHKPQFRRPDLRARRKCVRELLVLAARFAPDPFVYSDLRPLLGDHISQEFGLFDCWASFTFLVAHRFFRVAERRGPTRLRYELTEQAIRYLDWTGFDWSTRKVA